MIIGAVLLAISSCSSLPISATQNVCHIFSAKNGWYRSALKMQDKWEVPLHVPMAVMYHESKFRRKAKPPRRYFLGLIPGKRRSSAYGYSQAVNSTWEAYITQTKNYGARRTSFDDSMDFVGWYINKSTNLARIAKNDPYNQYLAYHEGWTGFRKESYKKKPWLLRVASEVVTTADNYQTQLNDCEASLARRLRR